MEFGIFAAPELKYLPEVLEEFLEMDGIVFGAYISRRSIRSSGRRSLFLIFFSGYKDLRERFVRDFDVSVGIVGLEQIVEFWQIFFDEIVF